MRRMIGLALCRHESHITYGSRRNTSWPSISSPRYEPRRWQSTASGTTLAALKQPKKAMCRHCGRFFLNEHLEHHIEQHHEARIKAARTEQKQRQPVRASQKKPNQPRQPAKRDPQNTLSLKTVRLVAKSAATTDKVAKSPGDDASPGSLTYSKAPQKRRTSSVGRTRWTESQQQHLLQLLRSGHTCRDIADRIGPTFYAVQMFIHPHRLRYIVNEDSGLVDQDKPLHEHKWPLTWSEIEVNELSSMHAEGLSHATMASRLGRSLNSIENALKHFVVRQPSDRANRADRPRRRHRPARLWTPEELAKLAAWYTYGLRTAEIAALLDRPETSVRKAAARCGVKMRPYRKYELKQGDLQMMQELRLSGHTVREIASRLQIPYQKAWKTARRNPLPTPPATAAQPSLEKSSGKSDPP